jgi:hypothetical protein
MLLDNGETEAGGEVCGWAAADTGEKEVEGEVCLRAGAKSEAACGIL